MLPKRNESVTALGTARYGIQLSGLLPLKIVFIIDLQGGFADEPLANNHYNNISKIFPMFCEYIKISLLKKEGYKCSIIFGAE